MMSEALQFRLRVKWQQALEHMKLANSMMADGMQAKYASGLAIVMLDSYFADIERVLTPQLLLEDKKDD